MANGSPSQEGSLTGYTIQGSFHYHADQLKINAQLINNGNGHIAWADRFEGPRDAIFTLQEDLLKEIDDEQAYVIEDA